MNNLVDSVALFWAYFSIISVFKVVNAGPLLSSDVANITRIDEGDTFAFRGGECVRRECGGRSESLFCQCACPAHAPLFREDTGECVEDITECSVAPFGTGISAQKIPFVFLPLKGQIIHPSKEISFPGVRTPICAVSGAQFLTKNGFIDLRNSIDSDVPFSLFRDEGKTFLQWTGEPEMRTRMEGRLLVVQLLCRDVSVTSLKTDVNNRALHGVFTPCAAFRVAGSPMKHITNVSEVLFSTDHRYSDSNSSIGLTMTEYIAIGISSVLLGLIYVASVFLYLHIKKKKNAKPPDEPPPEEFKITKNSKRESLRKELEMGQRPMMINLNVTEPGIVKNNPLMHFNGAEREKIGQEFAEDSGSQPSDPDEGMEEIIIDNGPKSNNQNHQITTSATIHPAMVHHEPPRRILERYSDVVHMYREEPAIERLPEENVSIVETMDERPEHIRAVGHTRKKLYFNPAFFEPHMLLDPPPAAIEFLVKIREVISIAKHKMAARRFTPSLRGIPEEESYLTVDKRPFQQSASSHRSSVISLKRENVRRKSHCSGCPGCSKENIPSQIPDINALGPCHSCSSNFGINKQVNVRKWLEGVPMTKNLTASPHLVHSPNRMSDMSKSGSCGMINSMLSLPNDKFDHSRKHFTTRSLYAEDTADNFVFKKKPTSSVKSEPSNYTSLNLPLPTLKKVPSNDNLDHPTTIAKIKDISPIGINKVASSHHKKKVDRKNLSPPPPPPIQLKNTMPDMINEALAVDKNKTNLNGTTSPTPMDNKKGASIISAVSKVKAIDSEENKKFAKSIEKLQQIIDYESDSLERDTKNKGRSTPIEYADVSSSQESPSLGSALPMEEEMTMKNATYKVNKQNIKADHTLNVFDNKIYNIADFKERGIPDYNLVTEVYVNNGYNYESGPTSPSESDSSTFGKRKPTIRYNAPEKPGHLTIEVQDPPENYIKIHESDGFEPDTLDRKPNRTRISITPERGFILKSPEKDLDIKPTGIFKTASLSFSNMIGNALQDNKTFGSLRNVYESKMTIPLRPSIQNVKFNPETNLDYEIVDSPPLESKTNDEGRLLTLEMKHCKRQRQSTPPGKKGTNKLIPPDVIPPEESIYEYPKPPRLVTNGAPPLPPKNDNGRSPSSRSDKYNNKVTLELSTETAFSKSLGLQRSPSGASVHSDQSSDYESVIPPRDVPSIPPPIPAHAKPQLPPPNPPPPPPAAEAAIPKKFREFQTPKAGRKIKQVKNTKNKFSKPVQYKEDSGYLSTDSNESHKKNKLNKDSASDSDDSNEDARSESGAESIETHSVFFGSFRKMSMISDSVDSGVGSESSRFRHLKSPSPERTENIKFVTLNPADTIGSRNSVTISDC